MRLGSPRRVVHDTTWWETHGFTGRRQYGHHDEHARRVPVDGHLRDRHRDGRAHAPDDEPRVGRARAPVAGRPRGRLDLAAAPARRACSALNDGSLSPDLRLSLDHARHLLRVPDPPAGYSTRAHADGRRRHERPRLTSDKQVVADNQWSSDGTKIIFRQTEPTGDGDAPPRAHVRRLPVSGRRARLGLPSRAARSPRAAGGTDRERALAGATTTGPRPPRDGRPRPPAARAPRARRSGRGRACPPTRGCAPARARAGPRPSVIPTSSRSSRAAAWRAVSSERR